MRVSAWSSDVCSSDLLRGGIDGLNLGPPVSGNDPSFSDEPPPDLSVAASGSLGALPLPLPSGAATGFGLHPSATGLHDIWTDGKLAIVNSCGLLTTVTRSHFDAQLYLDLGTPGTQGAGTGWITRAWNSQPGAPGNVTMPALAVNSRTPANLLGATQSLTMRTEEHTSELQSLISITYAVFCLKKKNNHMNTLHQQPQCQMTDKHTLCNPSPTSRIN